MNEYLIHVFFLILLIYIIMNLNINDLYHKLYLNNLYLIKILIIYLNLYPEIIELNNFLMIYPFLESLLLYKLFPLLVIELILFEINRFFDFFIDHSKIIWKERKSIREPLSMHLYTIWIFFYDIYKGY